MLLVVLGAPLVIAGLLYMMRNPLLSAVITREAAEAGVVCRPLDLALSWDLGTITVTPTDCRVEGAQSSVTGFALPSGASVSLAGTRVSHVRAPGLHVALRERRDLSEVLGQVLSGGRTAPPVAREALDALAAASQRDVPDIRVSELTIEAEERLIATVRRFAVFRDADGALKITARSVAPTASRRVGPLTVSGTVNAVEVSATAADAEIGARLRVQVRGPLAQRSRAIPMRFVGADLHTDSPSYTMSVSLPPALARLMEAARRTGDGPLGRLPDLLQGSLMRGASSVLARPRPRTPGAAIRARADEARMGAPARPRREGPLSQRLRDRTGR